MNEEVTRIVAIIGRPLSHSLSPQIHNAAFEDMNLNWRYIPLEIKENAIKKLVEIGKSGSNIVGFNVTMPYKRAIMPYLDAFDDLSILANAVNVVHFKDGKAKGYNTDVNAIKKAIAEVEPALKGKKVFIMGSGGVAQAAAVALAMSQVSVVRIANRTYENAETLKDDLSKKFKGIVFEAVTGDKTGQAIADSDIIINATPVGMYKNENKIPFFVDNIERDRTVVDMIYRPKLTGLLKEAKSKGLKIVSGASVFLRQAIDSFEIWTGESAPVEVMRAKLDQCLLSNDKNDN
jgi:shikimate dehydrogenase